MEKKNEYKITVCGCEISASAKFSAEGVQPPLWGEKNKPADYSHNRFTITVKANGKSARFFFYGSAADYEKGITEMDKNDVRDALEMILSDALSGAYDFSEFCSEFGYDTDSRMAEKIFKACEKTGDKLYNLGIDEDATRTIADAIREEEDKEGSA